MENTMPDDFIAYILESIVEYKDSLSIVKTVDGLGTLFEISVAEQDMGKIIGKKGQTIEAIRTLVRTFGAKNGERINLKVLEPTVV
jgi:predicted RNA-binding protein YlqC (UPF0109 family)